jgi:hypothetical protein
MFLLYRNCALHLAFVTCALILIIHSPSGFYSTRKSTWRNFLLYLEGTLSIYEARLFVCFCFVLSCHAEIFQITTLHAKHFMSCSRVSWGKLSMSSSQWVGVRQLSLRPVWSYGVEAIDYWTIYWMKLYKIETENCIGIWRCS